jgi:DNA-directed RNA polymerase subunit RPC12/RpoP
LDLDHEKTMSKPLADIRCQICRSRLDDEDLFCSNCGTENPHHRDVEPMPVQQPSVYSFRCDGCGASMSYDTSAKALRCPFCGSTKMSKQENVRTLRPRWVVPFRVPYDKATQILRKFLANGFWRPGDAASSSSIDKVTQVFVPFWVFAADTDSFWTGDSPKVPYGARGNWVPVSGKHQSHYDGILVGASSILTAEEIDRIRPFDLSKAVPPEKVELEQVIVEEFRLARKFAKPLAVSMIEDREAAACSRYLPGGGRNVRVNVTISSLTSEPVLLPIWIMVYHYRKLTYRVLINGQTGEIHGEAPFSYAKAAQVGLFIFFVLAMLIAMSLF